MPLLFLCELVGVLTEPYVFSRFLGAHSGKERPDAGEGNIRGIAEPSVQFSRNAEGTYGTAGRNNRIAGGAVSAVGLDAEPSQKQTTGTI